MVEEPDHRVSGQQELILGVQVRGTVNVCVRDRIDQDLHGDLGAIAVAGSDGHHGRQVSTGAIAGDDQGNLTAGDLIHVSSSPLQRRVGIVNGDRVAVLGRESIVDQHDRTRGPLGQLAAQRV